MFDHPNVDGAIFGVTLQDVGGKECQEGVVFLRRRRRCFRSGMRRLPLLLFSPLLLLLIMLRAERRPELAFEQRQRMEIGCFEGRRVGGGSKNQHSCHLKQRGSDLTYGIGEKINKNSRK